MTGTEIRQQFLDFFARHDHRLIKSSSLIPAGDPTLLFTNAGMNQFKDVFTGRRAAPHPRAASAQKCVRAGGKHNDLENVGFTARHHTFFEMLGNFSFGDYFKQRAIELGWELLTSVYRLPQDRLWITIFREDDEAFELWHRHMGIAADRILRLGEKDNFWAMGDTGPCGPCSEIHFDQGPDVGCGRPECDVSCDCDRYVELWNLVFMQFDRDEGGRMTPLPRPSIDTGMGLERVSTVLQGFTNNFDNDLFQPIIGFIGELAGKTYRSNEKDTISMRVIADHARALTFLIGDGVQPSNEWRGYVVRRILRRAMRHGVMLGLEEPFLHRAAGVVTEVMGSAYPELRERLPNTARIIEQEERRFISTLRIGMNLLNESMDNRLAKNERFLSGAEVFKLYDTYGFPSDLAGEIIRDRGFTFDHDQYEAEMTQQRDRARSAWKGNEQALAGERYAGLPKTVFAGYEETAAEATVLAVLREGEPLTQAGEGETVEIILDRTPFYGEAGGQTGDRGWLKNDGLTAEVLDTKRPSPGVFIHQAAIRSGAIAAGTHVMATIDEERRDAVGRNHTATHLLHAALRSVLGDHVKQAGSLVEAGRFRFDFSHYQAVSGAELRRIEAEINRWIYRNLSVETEVMPLEQALQTGAMALFDEKYEETVRVVKIASVSAELCGGTHRHRTGDIGMCLLTAEGSVAAGVRRLEGLTGAGAWSWVDEQRAIMTELTDLMKSSFGQLPDRVGRLAQANKQLSRETMELKTQLARAGADRIVAAAQTIAGVSVCIARFGDIDAAVLREVADTVREKLKSGVVVMGSVVDDKVALVAMVSSDLTGRLNAGKIIKAIAPLVGGGGGGRPEMAQAGGRFPERLGDALDQVKTLVRQALE